MLARFAADLLLVLHLGFILFVVAGGLLVLRWPWLGLVHLPAAVWGALIELAGWVCPLTPLEQSLRQSGGEAGYAGGFTQHYLLPLIYPTGLTREIQFALGAFVIVVNVAVYAWLLRRLIHRRNHSA
jgi:hypothetical protein